MPTAGRTWTVIVCGFLLAVALVGIAVSLLRLGNPEMVISIAPLAQQEARPVTVFVGGAVANPGVYSLTGGTTSWVKAGLPLTDELSVAS